MRDQIADLGLFESHVKVLLDELPATTKSDNWTPKFDLQPFLERFTMDTATEFLFGESVYSQKGDDADTSTLFSKKEMRKFVEDFYAAEETTAESTIYGDLFWLKHDKKFKERCKSVHSFVDAYIERRLRDGSLGRKAATERYVVLDALISQVKDPRELRSQLLNILIAGSDTISGTLGFLFATLAQYPEIFRKLRGTVIEEFGTFEQPKEITLSRLKNCSYLQWCLNEVLRVYPSVPANYREAVRDTTLPVGGGPDGLSPIFIPKGAPVTWEVSLFPIPSSNPILTNDDIAMDNAL